MSNPTERYQEDIPDLEHPYPLSPDSEIVQSALVRTIIRIGIFLGIMAGFWAAVRLMIQI